MPRRTACHCALGILKQRTSWVDDKKPPAHHRWYLESTVTVWSACGLVSKMRFVLVLDAKVFSKIDCRPSIISILVL